ncbi:3-hydroxyacyl-CoA dehydrogenase NAD-binding domain-containing protein [Pedobacter sp. P351]|uniref:3-hydroxyacyl-CoA dehydrogenase/enoyl-CoA hydratase family protein n=1 Tax=Pedobacter superstes TaxID=3133441 RepID=UPI0030A4F7AC
MEWKNRYIKKVAVLGSGVMGSRIACHFANIGVEVLLLDILPKDAPATGKIQRNKVVSDALQLTLKSNPSPIYLPSFSNRITIGNFSDDLDKISDCDWIIEAIIEKVEIKQELFTKVDKFRSPGTLITSNTSGIPIYLMSEGRSDDFRKHFCGTHFFNPPRYLPLLEIIPATETSSEVIDFLIYYGEKFLGKTTVLAKDTPGFIGNRIGMFSIMSTLHYAEKTGLSVAEIDKLTGPVIGHPKSATFRTSDVVGLDTIVHVANAFVQSLTNDEAKDIFVIPDFVRVMIENQWLGSKTEQGFYKKHKVDGKTEFLTLDLKKLEYELPPKNNFSVLETTKTIDDLKSRLRVLFADKDKAGEFYRSTFYELFAYSTRRIPEISEALYKIDSAMSAGFGWEMGPFEMWDALDTQKVIQEMEAAGVKPSEWVYEMIKSGATSFYKLGNGLRLYYDIESKTYKKIPGTESFILLKNLKGSNTIWSNKGTTITDLGDGILNLEFHTKMNTIGGEVIEGLNKAIDIAEREYKGLVISNEGANFSAGANIAMIFMMAVENELDELNSVIRSFQNTMMRIRYSPIPVVAAPHGMALGGGCELCLHADKVVAHAELYMGLVEFGVGLIPAGGGSKEFALRLSDSLNEGDVELNAFRDRFLTIGQAKVSSSAHDAFALGYLRKDKDVVVVSRSRLLAQAKSHCLQMWEDGYSQPVRRNDIKVLGKPALGLGYVGSNNMLAGNYISEHDALIAKKLAYVLSGGDLSQASIVSEQYLLDLEREAFISLCREKKTLERIQSVLSGGKILRN